MVHDAAGNTNTASTSTDNTVTYDVMAPTVTINQASAQADPTNASPINFTVVFSEPVTDFTNSDVTLSGTATNGATTATVTGSGATYNVAVRGMIGSGTIIASLAAGVAHDAAGNPSEASTSTDDTVTYNDTTPPTVTINQAAGQADPTNASPINFTVVFSEPVADFAAGGVTLSGTAGATTAIVTGSDTTYNVAVSGMTGSGTVIASVDAGVAHDAAGNGNTASTSTDHTVTYDVTAPTVTINQAAGQADPTRGSPINFTVVFSEAVTDFAAGDVTLGGTAGATMATVTGSGTTYTVAVSGMTNSGTVIASIAAGVAHDAVGNPNEAGTSTDNEVTYVAPKIILDGDVSTVKSTSTVGSSLTVTNTTGTGENRLMLLGVSWNANTVARTISSVTFTPNGGGAVNLTEVRMQQVATNFYRYAAIYSLLNPPTGQTGIVTINFSGSVTNGIIAGVANFKGVGQTTPLGSPNSASASNTAPTLTLTNLNDDELLFDTVFIGGNPPPMLTNSTSQTRLWTNSISNAGGAASTKLATGASVTMSWTASGSGSPPWAIVAVPIKPAVADTNAPIITTCATNQTIPAGANCQAALPDLTTQVVATDDSGGVTITQSPVAGTLLGLGDTVVTLNVKDPANNQTNCQATITVVDVTAPEITTCATNMTLNADTNCQAAIPDLTTQVITSEECPGAVTITQSPVAGTLVGPGDTVVTLTVKDVANNQTNCQATITVVDVTPPVITRCSTNRTLNADTNCQAAIPDLTTQVIASDGCGTVTVTQSPLGGALANLGDTVVTLTVKDAANNQATCQATITVVDGSVPDITAQPQSVTNLVASTATFNVTATSCSTISYQWMFGTNLLGGASSPTLTITNVQLTDAGGYTVVLSNAAGSITSDVATLTVLLPAAPTLSAGPTLLSNGHFHAGFTGTPNVPYTIEYADEVTGSWKTLTNLTSDGSGLIEFDDMPDAAPARRFYRVVYP